MENLSITKTVKNTHRFLVLDSWRGVSACLVALLHLMANSHFYYIPVVKHAGLFVDFFFVLSGFVIFANYGERLKQGFGVFRFMLLRFGRLYPLHIATLMAFISVDLLQIILPSLDKFSEYPPFSGPGESMGNLVSNFFLFHALDTILIKAFNMPSWSISAEFYTYLVFALGIVAFKTRITVYKFFIWGLSAAMLAYILFLNRDLYCVLGFFRCLGGFAVGGLCWNLWGKLGSGQMGEKLSKTVWSTLEVLIVVSIFTFLSVTHGTPYRFLLAPILFGATVLLFAHENGFISCILKKRFFIFLGTLSYSIYMNHAFIAGKILPAINIVVKKAGFHITTVQNGKTVFGTTIWQGDVICVLYLAFIIFCSFITYRLIETPGREFFRKMVYKKTQKTA